MNKINIEELNEGMMFTENAYIEDGSLFVMAHTPITDKDIDRLKTYHIKEIKTEGELLQADATPEGIVESNAKIKSELNQEELLDIEDFVKRPFQKFDFEEETKRLMKEGIEKFYIELRNSALRKMVDIVESVKADKLFNADIVKEIVNNFVIQIEKNKKPFLKLVNKFIPGEYYIVHSVNTCILSLLIGNSLGYSRIKQMSLGLGALLHDIGMVKLPPKITHKKGKLSDKEYNIIRTHPLISYKVLSESGKFTKDVTLIVLQHHERLDGKGYPRHVKVDAITDLTRIVQIASVYEALICKRTYREEFQYFEAMRQILNGCQGEFDPKFLKVFLSVMSYYPIGSFVKLSDDRIAEVIMSNPKLPMKPKVQIVVESDGHPVRAGDLINLGAEEGLYIVKPVNGNKVSDIRSNLA